MLRYHAEGFRKAGATVTAVADPAPGAAERAAKQWDIAGAYDSVEAMLANADIDAAVDAVERAGAVVADLVTTVEHNLSRDAGEPARFEGRAQNRHIDPRQLPAFRAFMEREGQAFLERCDEWLSAHEARPGAGTTTATLRLGAGVYLIQERTVGEQ